jgi:flagellin
MPAPKFERISKMISIQTNVNSLVAQQNLSVTSAFQSKTIAQLTSGYRINQSGDDAAGLAVANKFRSTVAELTQGVANGNDATAQLQIMDGGMSNISMILDRLKTLATQSASGTFTGSRVTVNSEFQNDLAEIDRQAQSIGLNSGGVFAKNLDVYLGSGSGSQSLQNGVVTLGLTQSAVDSQALGMKGMQAVNVVYAADGTNTGVSIGSTSTTSVQAIVGNTSGDNPNQEATAGYAALQFSGAGFSDAGKAQVSVNLAGVTDTTTLVAAINSAIQTAGNGITAAATAFKNANIVASVHTDSGGGQELAFSSSTSAFQVQAGDQMANALMGHVSIVGAGVAQGTAIAGTNATNVTGATTTDGLLTQGQTVKLVVTGGGLASPVTLQVNTSGVSKVSTSGAITDLETQFSGNALLAAAGLSMTGSPTAGGNLGFASAVGQAFNIQVTGDTANLLGLGSFSADAAGNADYTSVTAGAAYDATAVTGNAKTVGVADGLQVSLNGLAATALTTIDLTAGAHALAASLTSDATITGGAPGNSPGTVDITAANNKLNVTVINNGTVTNQAISLSTNTIASQGAAASTVMGGGAGAIVISAATTALNNSFMVAVDGGAAVKITLDAGSYATRALFLTQVQGKISASSLGATVTAAYADLAAPGDGLGALTLTSAHTAGVNSTVMVDVATTATQGTIAAGTLASSNGSLVAGTYTVSSALHNDKFMVSKDGAPAVEVTVAAGTTYNATTFLAAVDTATGMPAGVHASWDALNGNKLTLTSNTVASSTQVSSVAVSAATYASAGTVASTLATMKDDSSFVGFTTSALLHNNTFTVAANGAPAQDVTVTGTYTADKAGADAFLGDLNTALGLTSTGVTAGFDAVSGRLTLTSGSTGALSSVVLGAATYASKGTVRSTLASMKDDASFAGYDSTLTANSNMFTVTKDGGVAKDVTLNGTFAATKAGADGFLIALNSALGTASTGVTAGWDAATGNLTLTSGATGALSSVAVGTAHYTTSASSASSTVNAAYITGTHLDVTGTGDNKFNISVDGGASEEVTVGTTTYSNATTFLAAVQLGIDNNVNLVGKVTAGWDTTSGFLTLTANSTGAGSSITVATDAAAGSLFGTLHLSGTTSHGQAAAVNSGLTSIHLNASTSVTAGLAAASNTGLGQMHLDASTASAQGSNVAVNGGLAAFTLDAAVAANGNATHSNAGLATMGLTGIAGVLQFGATDGPASVASIAAQIQTALGIGNALVTVSNDYKISIASTTKGANSSVMLNATANSAYATLHLTSPVAVLGLNSSIADVVDNLNAQFAANGTAYQVAGLKAVATTADGTGSGNFITIQSNNSTQFRLNAVGVAAAATAATLSSTVTDASFSAATPLAVTLNTNDKIDVAVNGLVKQTIQVAAGSYTTASGGGSFLAAVQAAIAASVDPTNGLAGKVTAGWDTATRKLTLTSVATGTAARVTTSATSGNTGLANLGFGTGATSTGQLFSTTENTGFGVAGTTFVGAAPSSTGTSMSAFDAFGTSNSTAFTFSAMKYGSDKQALTFSATDSNGALETQTITLQNKAGANRAGVSIDTAVAYINQQLQQSTSNPALQKILAVKEVVSGAEQINFVSSLGNFTVGVAATANGDGLNAGVATQRISQMDGAGANMSVDTQAGGQAAVTALATAIAQLGAAQAAVGKGQNQLAYAVNLAQSQITNFSAAESQIRDANVAQQAANLSKAQVLSQASIAAMAQANSAPQAVLSLLRG